MSTKAKREKEGKCRLTGKSGKFVKSHILPRALTRLNRDGSKITEAALGGVPKRKPATWYDDELTIREGEDILEAIDTPAIEVLRSHTLIWGSFSDDSPFPPEALTSITDDFSVRELHINRVDADTLRLFFLSVVWRAAASSRPEFVYVQLEPEDLEDIRQQILHQAPGSPFDYPVVLDQIVTRGEAHNRTPIQEFFDFPEADGLSGISVPCVRIYMDGLVAQVLLTKDREIAQRLGALCLGANDKTVLFARSFEKSRTYENMHEIIEDNISRGYV